MQIRNIRIIEIPLFICLTFAIPARAQLASSKPLSSFYSNRTKEKLNNKPIDDGNNGVVHNSKLPSSDDKMKEKATNVIKSPVIKAHKSVVKSPSETKKSFPSNSRNLKQKGRPARKIK